MDGFIASYEVDNIEQRTYYWSAKEPTLNPVEWYFEFEQPVTVYKMDVRFEYKASVDMAYIEANENCDDSGTRISAVKYESFEGKVVFPITEEPKRPHKCFFVVLQLKEIVDGNGKKKYPAIAEVQFYQDPGTVLFL